MRALSLALPALLFMACATSSVTRSLSWTPAPNTRIEPTVWTGWLESVGQVFAHNRDSTPSGAQPPDAQLANWRQVLATVDGRISPTGSDLSSDALLETRTRLLRELEEDTRQFKHLPETLSERIIDCIGRLTMHLSAGRPREDSAVAWVWPIDFVRVTSLFGMRNHPFLKTRRAHSGVDLKASEGQVVGAAAKGKVVKAEWAQGYGYTVEVQHGHGLVTAYGHLSEIWVATGQTVAAGEAVGLTGRTGWATGAHLHFELWRDGAAQDPLDMLGLPPTRPHRVASK